jgi:hypothetical protein
LLSAITLISQIRERIQLSGVPRLTRGTAIMLVLASILSTAFMGFAGMGGWRMTLREVLATLTAAARKFDAALEKMAVGKDQWLDAKASLIANQRYSELLYE